MPVLDDVCDEHHHAAVEAVWGDSAMDAFNEAKYSIVLTGTPIRSDGKETTWFGFDAPTKFNAWEVLNPIGLTVDLVAKQK